MIPKRLLKRLSVRQLQEAIRLKKRLDKVSRLERIRDRHEREARKIQKKIDRLVADQHAPAGTPGRKRRRFSAATRRKMAEAQRRRWAKVKAAKAEA